MFLGDFMKMVKVSSKGQIVIPKDVRDALGLKPGDRVEIRVEGDVAMLVPLKRPSESMRGIGVGVRRKLGLSAVELVRELREEDAEEL